MNIIKKIIDKKSIIKKVFMGFNTFLLVCLILYLNVGSTLTAINTITYYQYSIYLFYFGCISFICYLVYKIFCNRKIDIPLILTILLGVFGLISYLSAFNQNTALYGMDGRNEGLLVLLSYYSFFLLAMTIPKNNRKFIIWTILLTGIYQIMLGFIQMMQVTNIFGYDRSMNWSTNFKFASGSFGNPNFYSTYILMCLMIVFGILLKEKKMLKFILLIVLFIIFSFGLFIGNTSSCLLSFGLIFIFSFIKKINKKNILSISIFGLVGILILLNSIFILNYFTHKRIQQAFNREVEAVSKVLKNGISDETGNGRVYIWKNSLNKFNKYFLTGIGIDNFGYVDDGTYLCTNVKGQYQCFDKAHNEYIQILITEGVFAFIVYLLIIIYTFYNIKKRNLMTNKYDKGLSLAFIGYLIQAIFNISVINVAPIFYMILGFLNNNDNN